jgi:hypothetical protein
MRLCFLSGHYDAVVSTLNVLLTVNLNTSVQQDQQDAQFAVSSLQLIACTCFEHLFANHQEVLYIQQLIYFVCIMSAGC